LQSAGDAYGLCALLERHCEALDGLPDPSLTGGLSS
jgi:hypothetical protein